jgi:hypothetical protein
MRRWPGWVTNVDFGRLSFVRFSPVANKQRHRGRAEGPRACIGPTDAVTSNSRGRLKLAKKSPSIDHGWRATWLNKCPLRFWAYSFTELGSSHRLGIRAVQHSLEFEFATRAEEWWVEADSPEQATVLLVAGKARRHTLGEMLHVELDEILVEDILGDEED